MAWWMGGGVVGDGDLRGGIEVKVEERDEVKNGRYIYGVSPVQAVNGRKTPFILEFMYDI